MKFEFARITEPLDMGDYFEGYRGQVIHVWINPPRAKRWEREHLLKDVRQWMVKIAAPQQADKKQLIEFLKKTLQGKPAEQMQSLQAKIYQWMADLWSQGSDAELHWTAAEIEQINDNDPTLYAWLTRRSLEMIEGYRAAEKKS